MARAPLLARPDSPGRAPWRSSRDAGQELVDVEHGGLWPTSAYGDRVRLDERQRDRRLRATDGAARARAPARRGAAAERGRPARPTSPPAARDHRRRLPTAMRRGVPSHLVACRPTRTNRRPGARQHGQHHVPPLAGELAHARGKSGAVSTSSGIVGLAAVLQQTAGAPPRGDTRIRKSANSPSALADRTRAPCEPVESSPRPGAAKIPGDEHERIIRALAVTSEDLMARCCGDASSESHRRIRPGCRRGEDELSPEATVRTTGWSRGSSDPTMRRASPDPPAVCRRAAPSPYSSRPSTLPTPSHVMTVGSVEHRDTHHDTPRPLECPVTALDERHR